MTYQNPTPEQVDAVLTLPPDMTVDAMQKRQTLLTTSVSKITAALRPMRDKLRYLEGKPAGSPGTPDEAAALAAQIGALRNRIETAEKLREQMRDTKAVLRVRLTRARAVEQRKKHKAERLAKMSYEERNAFLLAQAGSTSEVTQPDS